VLDRLRVFHQLMLTDQPMQVREFILADDVTRAILLNNIWYTVLCYKSLVFAVLLSAPQSGSVIMFPDGKSVVYANGPDSLSCVQHFTTENGVVLYIVS